MIQVLLYSLLLLQTLGLQVNLQSSPNLVGTAATMSMMVKLDGAIISGGGIRIKAPSQFSQQVQCTVIDPSATATTCKLLSANEVQIQLSSGQIAASTSVFIQITGFTNPSSTAGNQGFSVSVFDSSGIATSTLSNLSLTQLLPGVLQASVQPQTDGIGLVSPQTALLVSMTTSIDLPCATGQACSLIIGLPYLQENSVTSVIDKSQLKCELSKSQSVSLTEFATEIANFVSLFQTFVTVPCSLIQDSSSTSKEGLTVQLGTSLISKGTIINVKVWGFRNPLDQSPINGFFVRTADWQGGLIEVSQSLQLKVTRPSIINDITATLESGSTQILGISNIRLDFSVPVSLNQGCLIYISIPQDFKNLQLSLTAVKAYGMFGFIRSLPFQVTSNDIQITQACSTFSDNAIKGTIRLEGIQNPSVVADTDTFKLVVMDVNNNMIATTQTAVIIASSAFTPGSFISAKASLTNPVVQESTSIVFSLQSSNKLTKDGRVVIQMPIEFIIAANSTVIPISAQSVSTSSYLAVNQTSNKIGLRSVFYSFGYNPNVDGPLVFNLTSIVQSNPFKTLQDSFIKVQTWEQVIPANATAPARYGQVDETQIKVENLLSPGNLLSASFMTDSNITNSFPVNATITFTLSHSLQAGAQTMVQLPPDFGVAKTTFKCTSIQSFTSITPPCSVTSQTDGSSIIVVQGLKSLAAGSIVQFKLTSLRMPRYQGKLQGQILIQTGYSATELVDQTKFDFFTATTSLFESAQLSQESYVNSNLTSFTLNLTKPDSLTLLPTDLLRLTIPAAFSIDPLTLKCKLNLISTQCEYDTNKRILILALTQPSPYTIQVQGLRNALSIKQQQLQVSIIDSQARLILTSPQLMLSTTTASNLKLSLVQTSTAPLQQSDYLFQFNFANNSTANLYLLVQVQDCMAFQTVNVQSTSYLQLQSTQLTNTRIKVQIPVDQTGLIEFKVVGLLNPSDQCLNLGGITVQAFEDTELKIIIASGTVSPSLSCLGLCTACLNSQKDFCTACTSGYLLSVENGTCSTVCPSGSIYSKDSKQCQKCSSDCLECQSSTDFCTQCSDSRLFTFNGTCISQDQCQSVKQYFVDSKLKQCKQCTSPCTSCTESECLSCDSNNYLFEGTCLLSCPQGSIKNGNTCVKESRKLVLQKLVSDMPLAYSLMSALVAALLIKVTCYREMSLLVTFMILASGFESISLIELTIRAIKSGGLPIGIIPKTLLAYTPLFAIIVLLVCNVTIVVRHVQALQTAVDKEDNSVYERWARRQIFKRVAIYFASVILSFHNINWFNHDGMFPDKLKQRLLSSKFIASYSSVTKLSMGFPRLLMIAYSIYFGAFNAVANISLGNEKNTKLLACISQYCFLNLIAVFLMFLSLNYQWYDDPIEIIKQHELQKEAFNQDEESSSQPKLYVAKSSIELHMLKSSRVIKQKFVQRMKVYESTQQPINATQTQSVIVDDTLHQLEQKINRIEQVTNPIQQNELLQPRVIEESSQNTDNLDFDFLEQMKQTIIESKRNRSRKGERRNASDGKQPLKKSFNSDRTIKTQRFGSKNLSAQPERKGFKRKLSLVEEAQNTNQTIESVEHNASKLDSMTVKKVSKGSSTPRTKVETLIHDFDQEIQLGPDNLSSFIDSPLSVASTGNKFAMNAKSKFGNL